MKKDLVIGAVDNYDWSKLKIWANSIRSSGFNGDVIILGYRISNDVVERCKELNIDVYKIEHDSFGNPIEHYTRNRDTQVHQMRFFHIWQFLMDAWQDYRCVITTDVRDVWFQKNPIDWLYPKYKSTFSDLKLIASSEGIQYKKEIWNSENIFNGFGPIVTEAGKDWPVYNVGVLAGESHDVMRLAFLIHAMANNRYIPCDQSIYNILVNHIQPSWFYKTTHIDSWACHLGISVAPESAHYSPYLLDPKPIFNGTNVVNSSNIPYSIVHQYDRCPDINAHVMTLYK